jgi:hypothetical protein
MRVTRGEHTDLEARAKAEAIDSVVTRDYYTQRPQIRLTGDSVQSEMSTEITLDGNDVARLVECAIRHPAANMRYGVLAAIWNHPDSFRQIFEFGLKASPEFAEIRKIAAEELAKFPHKPEFPASKPAAETLLPRMPRPAHLKAKGQKE